MHRYGQDWRTPCIVCSLALQWQPRPCAKSRGVHACGGLVEIMAFGVQD